MSAEEEGRREMEEEAEEIAKRIALEDMMRAEEALLSVKMLQERMALERMNRELELMKMEKELEEKRNQ
eukprot:gene9369-1580_t